MCMAGYIIAFALIWICCVDITIIITQTGSTRENYIIAFLFQFSYANAEVVQFFRKFRSQFINKCFIGFVYICFAIARATI